MWILLSKCIDTVPFNVSVHEIGFYSMWHWSSALDIGAYEDCGVLEANFILVDFVKCATFVQVLRIAEEN